MSGRPFIADPRRGLWLGVALWAAGALVLWDVYERRGYKKPAPLRLLNLATG